MKFVKPVELELKNESERQYYEYILNHYKLLKKAYVIFTQALKKMLPGCTRELISKRMQKHDLSKFSEDEFSQYAQYFFPEDGKEPDKDLFDQAWKHHYQNNDHHPEFYWKDDGASLPMSDDAIAEMILDWIAMTFQTKVPIRHWYMNNKKKLRFNSNTKNKLDFIMNQRVWNKLDRMLIGKR